MTIIVGQRSTSPVPDPSSDLLLTVDDVTRGQVMTSLALRSGQTLAAQRSLKPGDEIRFEYRGGAYALRLERLANFLTTEDAARFVLSEASPLLSEKDKIERLLQAIAGMDDAAFIRNGATHSADDAAAHLCAKYQSQSGEITTAADFIDKVASRSSQSGQPYLVRLPDGTESQLREVMTQKLSELEQEP